MFCSFWDYRYAALAAYQGIWPLKGAIYPKGDTGMLRTPITTAPDTNCPPLLTAPLGLLLTPLIHLIQTFGL